MGNWFELLFLQIRHINAQQIYRMMPNITNHEGNENKNHNEILLPLVSNTIIKWKDKYWWHCGEIETLVHSVAM